MEREMGELKPLPDEELARLSVAIRADLDARDDAAVSLSATYALHLIAELRALREAAWQVTAGLDQWGSIGDRGGIGVPVRDLRVLRTLLPAKEPA